WPSHFIDHINGITNDNRIENLRVVTNTQSQYNTRPMKGSRSSYKGVWFSKQKDKWVAEYKLNYKKKHVGLFDNETDAAKA
ncbi:HNH endonuclease, partial [Kosakonia cowanii]|uniref:HNH endonuclease n=1 Tax=Kosakonia cowanii TaxID=208223 RepID=UPI0023F91F48